MSSLVPIALVRKLEYALLDPELNRQEIEAGCAEAVRHDCFAVIVKPHYIEFAKKALKDTGVKVGSVVGFPHGGVTTATKMYETQDLYQRGADEISMALNLGALRDHEDLLVHNDIATVIRTARGRPVTVIVETQLLNDEQVTRACKIVDAVGAAFVQTGTGFAAYGVTPADIHLLRSLTRLPVKACGQIDSLDRMMEALESGATRIVASRLG